MTDEDHPRTGRGAARVMGILNVTPNSFSDGGRFDDFDRALAQARQMVEEGADIIDIGGESTRPGTPKTDAETEIARVRPVLEAVVAQLDVPVSIDTMKARVAEMAIEAGARIVNDVWALRHDPDMAAVVAHHEVDLVMMHNRDGFDPALDVLDDLRRYFEHSLGLARKAGIADDRIWLDPGIGFGKTPAQSLLLVKRLDALRDFGFPILLGVSRKSSIGHVTGRAVDDRLAGTIAMNVWGLIDGVDIIRVHDVKEHVDAVKIVEAIRNA
ncbi:dihydropteroate synthase [Lutibaculum baratangense]|uniref:Dihydropteroate synthase n=1 Tax=Lutibaculum baratangense AMV1 TaxID=631454 RepID=V4QWP4_9HYPH|nr:dihydropteroate synthase [Lutibaculum baratangense]ESR24187.1 Dihydropteroate synthase [Lutibaculum baratangense AMV1]